MIGADLNTIGRLTLTYVCYLTLCCHPLVHIVQQFFVFWLGMCHLACYSRNCAYRMRTDCVKKF